MASADVATAGGVVADSDLHVMEPPSQRRILGENWSRLTDIPHRKCAPNR